MRVLVLEFNELSPSLLDRMIGQGELPNFARLRDGGLAAVTDAGETPPNLEPWIQWVTVHTGLPFAQHGCFQLNDGAALDSPRLWDLVSRAGRSNWVCGSMNAGYDAGTFKGNFLPDPWATGTASFPAGRFDAYDRLVRAYVQEHSAEPDLERADYVRFGKFMLANGLSPATIWAAIRQLAGERFRRSKWQRAMILDRLQWDLFSAVYRREKPDFATFFLNSTAHFQHFHWREMEPELFSIQSGPDDMEAYADAIPGGYRAMDVIVGKALDLAGDDAAVVLVSALSQQPMLVHEDTGGRQIYRHRDIARLLEFAGVAPGWRYAPIMSQQFLLHFDSEAAAAAAAERIEGLSLSDGRQPMWARRDGTTLDSGCMIDQNPGEQATVRSLHSNETPGFFDLFYPLEALRSGMHHPDGVLWIKAPGVAPARLAESVPLCAVAPTLAALAGVDGSFAEPSLIKAA
ncbi:MAG: alkaline phosphatase family protein [Novosphingobium sp.]